MRAIGSSPDEPFSLIYATLLSAIGSAETSVHLTNAYFVPDPQLLAALKDAAAARRRRASSSCRATPTPGWCSTPDAPTTTSCCAAGVKIYERRDALLHVEDGTDRRRVVDGRLDQPRLAQLPAQRGGQRRRPRPEFGAQMRAMFTSISRSQNPITLEKVAAPLDLRAARGAARPGLAVLVVSKEARCRLDPSFLQFGPTTRREKRPRGPNPGVCPFRAATAHGQRQIVPRDRSRLWPSSTSW